MAQPRNSSDDDTSDIPAPAPDDFADDSNAKMDQVIATPATTYILKTEQRKDDRSEFYDVIRRSDHLPFRMEFDKCDVEGATVSRRFELEATMRSIFLTLPNGLPVHHILLCTDLGAHSPWRFLVFPEEYISVSQFLSEVDKEDKTAQLAHRLAIQSFLGIQMLHKVDIVHGDIRPENMFIGANRSSRVVKIANFEHATSYDKEIPKCSDTTNLVYAPRGRMRNFEGSKKDDIESWLYCIADFYNRDLVPWHPDNKDFTPVGNPSYESDMLKLKRAFCRGKLWKATREVLAPEFFHILALMLKTKGRGEVLYDVIWNHLNSANLYLEANVFGIAPWIKANQGAPTTHSAFSCTPIENAVEDYEGKEQ